MNKLERLIHLAESFVWEVVSITDLETGSLKMAGWIPRIESLTRRSINLTITFHFSYVLTKRMVSTDPRLSYNSWYPFDTSNAVVFELVNATQVT
jgi:hypothetical protein